MTKLAKKAYDLTIKNLPRLYYDFFKVSVNLDANAKIFKLVYAKLLLDRLEIEINEPIRIRT